MPVMPLLVILSPAKKDFIFHSQFVTAHFIIIRAVLAAYQIHQFTIDWPRYYIWIIDSTEDKAEIGNPVFYQSMYLIGMMRVNAQFDIGEFRNMFFKKPHKGIVVDGVDTCNCQHLDIFVSF